jgi:hypothetical protein
MYVDMSIFELFKRYEKNHFFPQHFQTFYLDSVHSLTIGMKSALVWWMYRHVDSLSAFQDDFFRITLRSKTFEVTGLGGNSQI